LLYTVCKWTAGRQRPVKLIDPLRFNPFPNGWRGFLDEPNMSFPSGHTCLAFATAASLGICVPRWRFVFYPLAAVVAAERVAENAHYVSDVVAGAGLGTLSAYLVYWSLHRPAQTEVEAHVEADPQPATPQSAEARPVPEMAAARG
jgi:membrane-associated phospholipid phosphatase